MKNFHDHTVIIKVYEYIDEYNAQVFVIIVLFYLFFNYFFSNLSLMSRNL